MSDGLIKTRVNKRWLFKQAVITLIFLAFGFWALYDALWAYPARGANAAAYYEMQYLERLNQDGRPMGGIDDPAGQLARLRAVEPQNLGATDQALLRWLDALALISHAAPAHTTIPRTDFRTGTEIPDARTRLEALKADVKIQAPKPLSAFDIPSQWVILAACWGIGAWLLLLMLKVRSRTFRFDPASLTLTLNTGQTLTPADLAEVDKSLWHRFYVVLEIKPEHTALGGKKVKLDLMRYEPLEEWVLAMEASAFPDRAKAANEETATTEDSKAI